ncbi:hypothetical protein BGZ76_002771 [Entomortierella beljakovae]|nr:hypothetical protein BGZ76_002771 [Entomortierella beljakovae]
MVSVAEYHRLALVAQDPVCRVRQGFMGRIMKYLRARELHIRYLAVLFLAAHEPEPEWRLQIRSFLLQQSKAQLNVEGNLMLNELSLARLVHLMANHPDFALKDGSETEPLEEKQTSHSVDDFNLAAKYIEFYLETMANSENVSLIYNIASLLKTVRFVNSDEPVQYLYELSDLAQYLIQERSRSYNWTLASYPGQVKLPREIFIPLVQNDHTAQVSATPYLSSEWVRFRERKSERKSKPVIDRKIGQATKRRSRSPSPSRSSDGEGIANEGNSPVRAKRAKKSKKISERAPVEPTRRMASRAAKAKPSGYRDLENSEGEAEDEIEDFESDEE